MKASKTTPELLHKSCNVTVFPTVCFSVVQNCVFQPSAKSESCPPLIQIVVNLVNQPQQHPTLSVMILSGVTGDQKHFCGTLFAPESLRISVHVSNFHTD